MESAGEEKKLQALFSELRTADEQAAPRFAAIWNRAEIQPRRSRALNPAFVAVTAFVVCAMITFFVWSKYSASTTPRSVANVDTPNVAPASVNPLSPETIAATPGVTLSTPLKPNRPGKSSRTARRNAEQLAATRKLTREAKAISDWSSPTSTLLSFTSDELFTSLPQLDENASDLKSFLPSRPN